MIDVDNPVPAVATERHTMRCQVCSNRWTSELPMNVTAGVRSAALRAVACPKCGAGYSKIGMAA